MALQEKKIRQDLHKIIDEVEDVKVLEAIYTLLERELNNEKDFQISESHKHLLTERLEKYNAGETKLSEWEDVKKRIRNKARNDI